MTTQTQTQDHTGQQMIWLAVAIAAIVVVAYFFVW